MCNRSMDSELRVSFITYFSCQKDCNMSNVFLLTACNLRPSKFGRCNLKFNLEFDLKSDLESDLNFDLVTINSALLSSIL